MNATQRARTDRLRQAKATFDECVQAILDDPNFEPGSSDRTPEESAAAICATKPGGPQEGKATDPATALLAGDIDRLPARGRRIYDSMHRSSMRFFARARGIEAQKAAEDEGLDAYARGVAWRAVAEAYGFDRDRPAPDGAGAPPARTLAATPALGAGRKYAPSGAAGLDGDSIIVPIALNWRGDLARWYDRTALRTVPGAEGVKLLVGHERMKNATTLIYALVPRSVAGSMPGGIGAVDWVRRNMALLYKIGEADYSPSVLTSSEPYAKSVGETRIQVPFVKFVTSPEQAKRRITYGVVYPAWEVDLQGQYATAQQVERLAHGYMKNGGRIKLMHRQSEMKDGAPPGWPVESFFTREGDRDFPPEAWVMATEWHPEVWPDVVSKRLRGYSIGGSWGVTPLHLVQPPQEVRA
jgi:hypothetical protein